MLVEEQKLRWLGIDMRPRWRRRVAVVVTYVAIVVAGVATLEQLHAHVYWAIVAFGLESSGIVWLSVLRKNGIVKPFEDQRIMRVRGMGEVVFVEGLDEWAQYHYGVANFEAASKAQQDELLSKFKMGKRLFPKKLAANTYAPWLDEREVQERDSAERWTLKAGIGVLASYMGIYLSRAADHRATKPLDVAFDFGTLAVLMTTLPKARVLWTEADPRETKEELRLIHGAGREA